MTPIELSDLSDTARALIVDSILKIDADTFSDSVKEELFLVARLVSGEQPPDGWVASTRGKG